MAITKNSPLTPRHLLVRPIPLKGESLRGFLLRARERNGCGKGIDFLAATTGYRKSVMRIPDQAMNSLAQSFGLSWDQVEGMSYRPVSDDVRRRLLYFGHTISVRHLRNRQPAICPACLAEQQAISGLWDLTAVCVCPRHGNWLIDRCPACCGSFKWNRTRVANCQCGFDLRTIETKSAPSDVLVLTTLIHELVLNDLPTFYEQALGYPEAVRQLRLNELLGLFQYTGNLLMTEYSVDQQLFGSVTEAFAKHSQATVLLAYILKDWPNNFWLVLAGFSNYGAEDIVLTASEFNSGYFGLLQAASEPKSLALETPAFLKQALLQFRDDHCIHDAVVGRYLNPISVCRSSDGQRVLRLHDCLYALGLKEKCDHDEFSPFSVFLSKKNEYHFEGSRR